MRPSTLASSAVRLLVWSGFESISAIEDISICDRDNSTRRGLGYPRRVTIRIEAGERQYELVEGWGQLPDGWKWGQVAGVACDSKDRVHVYTRTEHPYMVFDKSGQLVHHGGEDFDLAHSL